MKSILLLIFLMFANNVLLAQHASKEYTQKRSNINRNGKHIHLNGQWKGGFNEMSMGLPIYSTNKHSYVLELHVDGSQIFGYSYTYFREGDKKYYTICRVTGSFNRETNDLIVTEVERTKFNTPPGFGNCFQTHRLHYSREGDSATLRGTWIPAPNQPPGCGSGQTVLSRRITSRTPLGIVRHKKNTIVKATPKKPATENEKNPSAKRPPAAVKKANEKEPIIKTPLSHDTPENKAMAIIPPIKKHDITGTKLKSRRNDIVKTIAISSPTFQLDFYDNGEIDGDAISVFYNGKLVLSNKALTDKPISLILALDKNTKENIVTMYADNLGTIPPNTALMIVTDGDNRYEVRITSDTEKSGSVVFISADK